MAAGRVAGQRTRAGPVLALRPPADTPLTTLVGLAKLRWRIEHDYREMKQALGLAHFEGRTYTGWHHHVTLVALAHAYCTLRRRLTRAPKERQRPEPPPGRPRAAVTPRHPGRRMPHLPLRHTHTPYGPDQALLGWPNGRRPSGSNGLSRGAERRGGARLRTTHEQVPREATPVGGR
ncbi:transposase [Kitasatospora sp. NPDC085879]|uniref:transposase n=1 Tax=Kitasatospora sp. NPDC085879 TaxID=3154769 RepID=UPI00341A6278